MSLQQEIIDFFDVKPTINLEEEIRKRVDFLKDHVKQSGTTGMLVAISGGLDSAVVAALIQQAADELTAETGMNYMAVGVFQPYGDQVDIEDSYAVAKAIGMKQLVETNIEDSVDELSLEVEHSLKAIGVNRHISRGGLGNLKARTRMVIQYAIAFEQNLLVVGTDQASEGITGFQTKYGDGAVDLHPMSSLNKRQVALLAAALNIPQSIIDKVPTAGLWEGQTDEAELGITYDAINDYLEGKSIDEKVKQKLEKMYLKTKHKRIPIPRI